MGPGLHVLRLDTSGETPVASCNSEPIPTDPAAPHKAPLLRRLRRALGLTMVEAARAAFLPLHEWSDVERESLEPYERSAIEALVSAIEKKKEGA